ncbi:retropepsin-like aspartic protease [Pedobacter sp. SYSU D00535]|uniref:retropepsin-like aspartic protease n=1 Tax=Pedobacter sp. SYSU D00535 TaxID=2810308 RepID=UPI001A973578|nr:retropepsin-like aspartic protease [Pedobacter sp. SYSU D00535]
MLNREEVYGQFQLKSDRKSETIAFKMVKNLMVVSLTINNEGPFNFILDTGVGIFLITHPALTESLGLRDLRQINITGFGEGEELRAKIAPSVLVQIGPHIEGHMAAAVLEEDHFGLSSYIGSPIHGLLGYEFFNSFVVHVNYMSNTLRVYPPEKHKILRKGQKIPISIEARKPYTHARIIMPSGEKITAKLVIDSGAGHPLSLETYQGQPFIVPQQRIEANLGVGLLGAIEGYIARVPTFILGKFELHNVITAFPNYTPLTKMVSQGRNGNLGNIILRKFNIILDYNRGIMYLKPNSRFKEPFEHDMSGLELLAIGPDLEKIIIGRVEKGSAAWEIGLQEEDEIVSVNFKPVSQIGLEEIYNLFRAKTNKTVILSIIPKGTTKPETVLLTLKRRI